GGAPGQDTRSAPGTAAGLRAAHQRAGEIVGAERRREPRTDQGQNPDRPGASGCSQGLGGAELRGGGRGSGVEGLESLRLDSVTGTGGSPLSGRTVPSRY